MTVASPHGAAGELRLAIYDRASVRVDADVPSIGMLRTMFAPFVTTEAIPNPDIVVRRDHQLPEFPAHSEDDLRYDETSVWVADIDVQVRRADDGQWQLSGSRELLTSILPLVDEVTTRHRAAMIHATTVAIDGVGVLMPAWGGVGKTSTMAKLMKHPGCQFMGDDWGFLSDDGELLGYQKPMFIKPHHRPIYPHLFDGARKPLIPKQLSKPVGRLTTRVHPFVTQYPNVAGFVRKWSPEHRMVTPEVAFPDVEMATSAPLALSVFVERWDGHTCELRQVTSDWMLNRLVGNFYSELATHSRDLMTSLTATGLLPMHQSLALKAEVVAKGLTGVPCYTMAVPAEWSADRASDEMSATLLKLVADGATTPR